MLKEIFGFLIFSWRLEKKYMVFLLINELLTNIIIVINLISPKYLIDALFITKNYYYATLFIIMLLLINLVIKFGTNYIKFFAERARDRMYTKHNISMAKEILQADYSLIEQPSFYDLYTNAMKCMTSNYGFAGVIVLFVNLLGKLFLIINLSFVISFLNIFVLLVLLSLIFMNIYVNSKIKRSNIKLDFESTPTQRRAEYFKNVTDSLEFTKEIRINLLQEWIIRRYKSVLILLKNIKKKRNKNIYIDSTFNNVMDFLENSILYIYLIYKTFSEGITQGDFVMYLGSINRLNSSVTEAFQIITDLNSCKMYFKPFNEFMNLNKNKKNYITANSKPRLTTDRNFDSKVNELIIEFENVSFRYPGQEKYTLKDINIKIYPREKISIIGENGAGKTTFIKLLVGLYEPSIGRILLNGVDIKEYSHSEYWGIFSVVFQDFKLFSLSMKENIILDAGENSEHLKKSIDHAGLSQRVCMLDKGLETQLYKNFDAEGIEPSGGEGQKIAIARALYKDAKVVILDEPTAALDPRAEYEIYKNFDYLTEGKTSFYISHRLSSAKFCDRIFVFDQGSIVECGSHEELLSNNALYAELFSMQAQFYL